jgi:hypothetical protein
MSCVAACGVFAGPLHAEVARWTAETFPSPQPRTSQARLRDGLKSSLTLTRICT